MEINHIYVINLQTESNIIKQKLNNVDWPSAIGYDIIDAANGWDIVENKTQPIFKHKPADWWELKDSKTKWFNRPVTPGEIGCMLSHYQCIHMGYKEGYENILILEEDFYKSNKSITQKELDNIPKDASIIYLDRKKVNKDEPETRINEDITEVGYTYNNHAYIVTRKGMKEIINSSILDNVIAGDEFFPAINGTSDRKDAVKIFHNPRFKAYAFNGGYFDQSSHADSTSLTEFSPKIVRKNKLKNIGILDASDWKKWSEKYINPQLRNREFDLITDEPAPHVYVFPLFTKEFCDELIKLGETKEWTHGRHEFYPTTDNLLSVLGMEDIYNKVINYYVRPYAINRFQLEGNSWDHLSDESFIIKYPFDEQSHLGVHHDYSSITTLVNLNPGGFEGGGTYFPKYKCLVNPKEIGMATLHPGNITHKHGARPTTSGTRYVVVSFISNSDHKGFEPKKY
tara:strand:+ start:122 stop:1489 length:1368 start_codon:yes stop_codon:yes gene_type:complete